MASCVLVSQNFLGRCSIHLVSLADKAARRAWLPLSGDVARYGALELRAQWLTDPLVPPKAAYADDDGEWRVLPAFCPSTAGLDAAAVTTTLAGAKALADRFGGDVPAFSRRWGLAEDAAEPTFFKTALPTEVGRETALRVRIVLTPLRSLRIAATRRAVPNQGREISRVVHESSRIVLPL